MVSKVFEKLVNNRIVEHLEKLVFFLIFSMVLGLLLRSTADLLTVVSDRLAITFNRSRATRAVALDIFKAFYRVWHAVLLHKLKSYGIPGQIFGLISSFFSNKWLRVVHRSLHRNIQLILEFLKGPFFVLHFSYYKLMTFLAMLSVILLSMLMILLSILSVIRHLI